MEAKLKKSYIEEINYQIKMLNNLKKWLKISIILSSISFTFVLFGSSIHLIIQIIGAVVMFLSILACMLIGLGYKNGKANVNKIIDIIEK